MTSADDIWHYLVVTTAVVLCALRTWQIVRGADIAHAVLTLALRPGSTVVGKCACFAVHATYT